MLARQMEVYAAYLEFADHHVGRLIKALEDLGVLNDTLVYYIIGDNGASAEGTLIGTTNELFIGEAPDLNTPEWMIAHIDDLGSPRAYNHYAVGWAHAMDTPASAAHHIERVRSALMRHNRNAGSGAAATRLKCPVLRATRTGDQAKATPAMNASRRVVAKARRASAYVQSAVMTLVSRYTRLKLGITPAQGMSGRASRFRNAV